MNINASDSPNVVSIQIEKYLLIACVDDLNPVVVIVAII